ncbi:hypothetical protein Voc01_021380 [Virgisporangium ochraceum]|uniref:Uncharacterized protein n=1 Tax=Virgisporangium ochraceum TaxID=65505 RepID=A0A8J3ZTJ5_9ACTN|nr:hypothetical protein Voc01_021380 [Virgisporangium ochraceum]
MTLRARSEPSAAEPPHTRWCRACGAVPRGRLHQAQGESCGPCGTPLDPPEPGPERIGRIVLVGNRLLPRHAVAVAERVVGVGQGAGPAAGQQAEQHLSHEADHPAERDARQHVGRQAGHGGDQGIEVLVLDRSDTPVPIAVERFDRLPEVTLPVPAVTSAAGRLWAAIRARAAGAFRARWSDAAVDSAAVDAATISLGTRRSAALDLVTLGLAPRPELGLSRFETAWYQARGVAYPPPGRPGDPAALLRLLAELPAGGYPDRVRLLMPWLTELCADPRLRGTASELVEPFTTSSADARALVAVLSASPQQDVEELLGEYVRTAGTEGEVALARAIVDGGPLPDAPGTNAPALADLRRHASALARCREDPGGATDEDLATVGFVAERARRAYLAGDAAALSGDHEAERHYRALLSYRAGEPFESTDLRPVARSVVAQLDGSVAGAEVAADPSAWPALWRAAIEGPRVAVEGSPAAVGGSRAGAEEARAGVERAGADGEPAGADGEPAGVDAAGVAGVRSGARSGLLVEDDLRAEHPEFGCWLDLGAVHRSLADGHWAGAAAAADAVASVSGILTLRAEALNLAAYACWQLGRTDDALRRLDEALAVHPTEGVAVNAALVADGAAVLPYLARVMGLTASPTVRAGALTRAIDLWTAGMCGPGYPPALAAMVRGGLAVPQDDDELHRTLLTLSFRNDRAWLASASVTVSGALQERTTRYVQRRAAYETRPSKVTLRAVTVALVGVWRLHPRPAWATAELAWLTDVFERLLEAPFDSATNPVPAVETLLGTEVLDLAPSLILSVRAGAHLARAAERRGRSLPSETERKLVLDPVRTYRMRRAELDEQDRKSVEAALAAGLEAATGAIVTVTVTRNRQLVRRFRQLEMEPVQDYADGRRVVAQRMYVLDRFDGHVRRCRAYLKAMDGLPVNEGFVRQVRDAIDGWTGISSRVRRSLRAV